MNLVKSLAVWSLSKGLQLPHAQLDRMGELAFLRRLLEQLRVDCVLDVGANRGQFARELRGIGFAGNIISFEPLPDVFDMLQAEFEGDAKWRGYNFALGGDHEFTFINVHETSLMSSLLETVGDTKGVRKQEIEVRRLDSILPELVSRLGVSGVFLKMDTQGYDLEVFKGASQCIEMIQGIQSELSIQPLYQNMPHYLEALQIYESAGFDLYNLSVVNRVANGGLLELNCFMRRRPQ